MVDDNTTKFSGVTLGTTDLLNAFQHKWKRIGIAVGIVVPENKSAPEGESNAYAARRHRI